MRDSLDALRPADESAQESAALLDGSSLWFTAYPEYSGAGPTWTFCRSDDPSEQCSSGGYYDGNLSTTYASVQQGVLMRQVLNATHDPAAALSAELTVLARMHYYDSAATFNMNGSISAVFFVSKSFPQETRGLAVVLAVCCTHVVVVTIVTVYFGLRTGHSLLDNSWSAAAQMQTESVSEILRTATALKDKDVEETIKASGRSPQTVRIRHNWDTGRIEAME